MTDLNLLAFEIAEAKKARADQKFNLNSSSLDKARKALHGSTFFDIETAGLDPKGEVYESGFLKTSATGEETYRHSFYKTDTEKLSGFTQRTLKDRAIPKGMKINDVLSNSTVGQDKFAEHFKSAAAESDVWVHNLNFESRFLGERMDKNDFVGWAQANKLESYSDYSPRLFETNMGVKKAVGAAEGLSYTSRGTLDNYLDGLEDVFSSYRSAFIDTPKVQGVTRVADSMTLARSVLGLAQKKGAMAKTGEVFAGTSIEQMARAAFGLTEKHTALGDSALQKGLVEFLFATGMDLQDGRELTGQQKNFFTQTQSSQGRVKQEGAVKSIVDTFNNQQRYSLDQDPERLRGARTDIGNQRSNLTVSSLQPDGTYATERVDTFRRTPFNPDNTTTDIDAFVAARKKAAGSQWGLTADWDAALETAKARYIDPFKESMAIGARDLGAPLAPDVEGPRISAANNLNQSLGHNEILERTLKKFEPLADQAKRFSPPDLSAFATGKKFLGDNWKVGAGVGLGIFLLSKISGKDDDYNYLEGLKHQGFAGETRRYNTDFGSGIQNFFRAAKEFGGKLFNTQKYRLNKLGGSWSDIANKAREGFNSSAKAELSRISDRLDIKPANSRVFVDSGWNASHDLYKNVTERIRSDGGGFKTGPAEFLRRRAPYEPESIRRLGDSRRTSKENKKLLTSVERGDFSAEKLKEMGVRDVRAQAKAYFKLEHNKPKFEPVDKAHIEHRVKTTLEGKNRDVEDLGYRRIEGIVSSYEKKIAQGKYDAFSPDAPDLVGYRAHSTSDQGLEAILATKRLLPGSTNVQHADGVGVYASMLKSGRADLRAAPATSGGYGKNTFFIKNTKNSDAVFSPAYGDSGHEITRNQSLELFGVRNISGNAPSRMGKQAPLSAQIHTDASIIRQKNASFSATKSSYEKSLSRLEGGGDSSWSSMDNFISSSNNYQKALEEIQPRSTTEAFRNYFKSTPTVDLSTVNRNKYFVVDDVVAHDYNPNHMGRPTKLVKEEHGASLAFSNAEALGFSDPAKRGVMESVFGLAKDIEAMGGQLHIKGGVARNRLVGKIRPEWAKESKDIDLLVTGGIPTDKIYGAMEGRQAFFDVETTSTLEHFFPTTDSSLNQAVIRVGGDGSENLIFTKGAAEDILAGRQRYLDNSDSGRASQRIAKRESDFPGLTTTRGEIPGMNEPYKIIHGFDDAYNTIEGFPHSGIAGTTRPKNTAFASPWQGAANDIKRTLGIMNQSSIARGTGANDGISKRESDDRQVAQIGIRSYAVEDADTVKLMLQGGGEMSLRLAGIDAPETTHEGFAYNPLQDQPYGQEATSRLEELMAAQGDMKVLFSPDSSQTYGRTAGLIVAEDGTNVNLELVRAGAAAALPYGPSSDRIYSTGEFTKAQAQAQESGEGMWGMGEWQAAQNAMGTKRRMTHNTLSDPQDIYQNFRAAAVLHRMRNPDASLSGMMAAGGKDDFNIHEGLNHGWANANRRADIGDFGSGYVIDKVVKRPARSFAVKAKLMNANNNARSYVKSMFDNENHIGHHRS